MKLIPYKELIGMAKEKVQEALAPMRAREMRKQAELEQCKIDAQMLEVGQKIQELASAYPIDFGNLIAQIDKQALLERRKGQYDKIIQEMFPE